MVRSALLCTSALQKIYSKIARMEWCCQNTIRRQLLFIHKSLQISARSLGGDEADNAVELMRIYCPFVSAAAREWVESSDR